MSNGDGLEDAIPLAGGDDDRVYNKPASVSSGYTKFLAQYGEPEKISTLPESTILACAKAALVLKDYFKQKYDPTVTTIESAVVQATAAKNALANIQKRIAEDMENPTASILNDAVGTLEKNMQGANTAQAMAICGQVAKAVGEAIKKSPAKYGKLKGPNDSVKESILHGIGSVLESFLKTEVTARIECAGEGLTKLGYKETGAGFAERIERRAAILSKFKDEVENAQGWHNQEIAFWIKRAGDALKGKDELISQLTEAEKSALGLTPPQSKIKFTGGAAGAKWVPGKPTWDGRPTGLGGLDVDSNQR